MARSSVSWLSALSCAALLTTFVNCGSSGGGGSGTGGSNGSAGITGGAGSSATAGTFGTAGFGANAGDNGSGVDGGGGVTAAGGASGNAGANGNAGVNGSAGVNGNAGATGTTDGGPVVCSAMAACPTSGDQCSTDCAQGQQSSCFCFGTAGKLQWSCFQHACFNNNDGGTVTNDGGNGTGAGGMTGTDGGGVFAGCAANVANMTACTAGTDSFCQTACTTMKENICFCAGAMWFCTQQACQ
jgi:hypothetical protein